ncbi:hypothetical protein LTR36_002117 [Oleoguttula mirabilis]|uniref:Uncharacterized protein n=1 Tax=Oleoguttula mirabilis TaxID=1507867 RepID=A0AAV9JN66_9PEZI|nr:hypothetical protein LTR36_002117 [Oleoguttula mirabilis]
MDAPPYAPMPPPPGFGGEYAGGPGAIPINDWPADDPMAHRGRHGGSPPPMVSFMDDDVDPKPKKKKDRKPTEPVEVRFEGYMLQRAEPLRGQKPTWARVGKRDLPFDDKKLETLVKEHRLKTRTGPATDFAQLTANQQGVVNRLVEDLKQTEKNFAADWVLADVQRSGIPHLTRPMEVRKIRVIIKRQDRNYTKPESGTNPGSASTYQSYEIIDLNEPVAAAKGGKAKKGGKKQQDDGIMDVLDGQFGVGIPGMGQDPAYGRGGVHGQGQGPFQGHNEDQGQGYQHQQQQQQHYQPGPMGDPMGMGMGQHPPPLPPGAFPVEQPFQPPVSPPFVGNPFQPNPEFVQPGQYQSPFMGESQDAVGGQRPRARVPLRSLSRPRRSSSARRMRQLEGEVEDLKDKMENWHISSGSSAEGDSVFSRAQSGGSFTPPSTPPLSDAGRPRGSLHRRKSLDRRPSYRAQPRDRRYTDEHAEVRPAYTPQPRAARHAPERHRYSPERSPYSPERLQYSREERPRYRQERPRYVEQPRLQRSVTYDDYPVGRAAEPRFESRPQRRLTNYEESYPVADFDDQSRRQRDAQRQRAYDPIQDAFDAGRRERVPRRERRRSSVVGSGYYM